MLFFQVSGFFPTVTVVLYKISHCNPTRDFQVEIFITNYTIQPLTGFVILIVDGLILQVVSSLSRLSEPEGIDNFLAFDWSDFLLLLSH